MDQNCTHTRTFVPTTNATSDIPTNNDIDNDYSNDNCKRNRTYTLRVKKNCDGAITTTSMIMIMITRRQFPFVNIV